MKIKYFYDIRSRTKNHHNRNNMARAVNNESTEHVANANLMRDL